jgi:serine/threonine-protein kinase
MLRSLQNNPETAIIPFLFLSAKARHEDIRQGMDLGADDYLTKPFTAEELMQSVRTRLARYKTTTQLMKSVLAERSDLANAQISLDGEDTLVGRVIRGYEFVGAIGEGTTGRVYLAYQSSVGRQVAIKILHQRFAEHTEFVHRFHAEAELVARLEHPHIVPLYDFWDDAQGIFIVMRWLKSGSLRTMLSQEGSPSLNQIASILEQVASGLSIAHDVGIIHRDIKPDNILIDDHYNAYLTDFGLAKNLAVGSVTSEGGESLQKLIEQQEEFFEIAPQSTLYITDKERLMGTPAYLAPEQIENGTAHIQTDIYSLGITVFEMLTGTLPFTGSVNAVIMSHLMKDMPLLSEHMPNASAELEAVIQKATHKDWTQRYDRVLAFAEDFWAAVHAHHR